MLYKIAGDIEIEDVCPPSDNTLVIMAVDYWCDTCQRQPMNSGWDKIGGNNRRVCDICNKPTRLIQSPKKARLIMDVLFLKL